MDAASVRLAEPHDIPQLAGMRAALWPDSSAEDHAQELASILSGEFTSTLPLAVMVAQGGGLAGDNAILGFLEVGLRSHAEGCDPSRPVGYVEGWFVQEAHRGRGIGAALLHAAEDWACARGCIEIASDSQISNLTSQKVHLALGFSVVERSVNYRKTLSS